MYTRKVKSLPVRLSLYAKTVIKNGMTAAKVAQNMVKTSPIRKARTRRARQRQQGKN